MEEMTNAFRIVAGKCEKNKLLGTLGRRYKNNIKMCHKELGYETVDWIHLAYI
jgi:hypothetical protein